MDSKKNWQARLTATVFAMTILGLAGVLASTPPSMAPIAANPLPVGTILPVRLDKTLSLAEAEAGQVVEAKIMQDVPLPNKVKIHMKSTVVGTVLSKVKDGDGSGVQLTLQFNKVEYDKQMISILTSLRAIASFEAVRAAQMSFGGADGATPAGWADTAQIGGDIRYGDGGAVRNRQKEKVGKGVIGGVLVYIRANPKGGCGGPAVGDDRLQALWVFSSDACGVYDLRGVKIVHQGNADPAGTITLHFEKPEMKLEAGTAMLLRVVAHQ
jgi:hypothetical protein